MYGYAISKHAEAVGKPRERQDRDEASDRHEAESLSLGLGQRTAASRAFEFCEWEKLA